MAIVIEPRPLLTFSYTIATVGTRDHGSSDYFESLCLKENQIRVYTNDHNGRSALFVSTNVSGFGREVRVAVYSCILRRARIRRIRLIIP